MRVLSDAVRTSAVTPGPPASVTALRSDAAALAASLDTLAENPPDGTSAAVAEARTRLADLTGRYQAALAGHTTPDLTDAQLAALTGPVEDAADAVEEAAGELDQAADTAAPRPQAQTATPRS
jgi:hypothetical protein